MPFLNRLSISTRLLLIGLVPTLALLFYLQDYIRKEIAVKNETQTLISNVKLAETMSSLIQTLQKERAYCISFLSSDDESVKEEFIKQMEETQKFSSLYIKESENEKNNALLIEINRLQQVRNRIVKHSLTPDEAGNYYNNLKSELLLETQDLLKKQSDLTIRNLVNELMFVAYMNDFLARLRSQLTKSLRTVEIMHDSDHIEIISTYGKMNINLEKYLKTAKSELKNTFQTQYYQPIHPGISSLMDSAIYYRNSFIKNVSYDECWYRTTMAINTLKNIEESYFTSINSIAEKNNESAKSELYKSVFFAGFILLVLIVIISGTIRGITQSVSSIVEATEKMTQGNTAIEIDIQNKDEIGLMADSIRKLINSTNTFSQIAESIGKGNYDVNVPLRSDEDTLGTALDSMKTNLKKLHVENKERNWILSGNAIINEQIRGEKEVRQLAADVIQTLCRYMNVKIGAIYLCENNELKIGGSYAYEIRKQSIQHFKNGEGLVGQSAFEQKPILFTDVPDDYVTIHSGLGKIKSRA